MINESRRRPLTSSSRRALWGLGLAAVLIGTGAVVVGDPVAASAAPSCREDSDFDLAGLTTPQDINNDAVSDLAVGVPSATTGGQAGAGAVDVRYSVDPEPPRGTQRLDAAFFGRAPKAGDHFGAAVTMTQLGHATEDDQPPIGDDCSDLLIGVPGANGGAGIVIVARGSADGIRADGFVVLSGKPGDHFGASIAGDGDHVFVGAPGRTVNGARGAGAIDHFVIDGNDAHLVHSITENSAGVTGLAEPGDGFGSVLRYVSYPSVKYRTLLVGVPAEDVGSAKDAGIMTVLRVSYTSPKVLDSSMTSQNTAGIGGSAEAGDRFGAAVDYDLEDRDEPTVAVGAPGEDLGSRKDAGSVQVINCPPGQAARQFLYITQDSPSVGGAAESGDQFGASVLFGGFKPRAGQTSPSYLAVGAPGEAIGSVKSAGAVSLLTLGHPRNKPRTIADAEPLLYQGDKRVGGTPATGDRFGAGLSALEIPFALDSNHDLLHEGGADLVVATPGDDLGAPDAGTLTVRGWQHTLPITLQDSAGAARGETYGIGAVTQSTNLSVPA